MRGERKMNTSRKSKTVKLFIIALLLCFVSMIGTALMESAAISTKRTEYNITLDKLAAEIRANNQVTGKDIQVTFKEDALGHFHFRLFTPKNATAEHPVPGIVCAHGGSNVLELQLPLCVELARRGYAVITMDMDGHGETDNIVDSDTSGSHGMLAAVEFLMSLPYVDKDYIGVTGHSLGNNGCYNSIVALNTPDSAQRIRSWVDGDDFWQFYDFNKDNAVDLYLTLGVGKYSEQNMPTGYDFLHSFFAFKLSESFGIAPNFEYGKWYSSNGEVAAPAKGETLSSTNGLKIVQYPGTHPMWFFSKAGVKIAVDGFYETLGVPYGHSYIESSEQIWPAEVAFQLLGLLAFFTLFFPLFTLLADTKLFAAVKCERHDEKNLLSFRDPRVAGITIITALGSITFAFVTYINTAKILGNVGPGVSALVNGSSYPGNTLSANHVAYWTFISGVFTIAMIFANYAAKWLLCKELRSQLCHPFENAKLSGFSQLVSTAFFAVVFLMVMYLPVAIAGVVFHADFRISELAVQVGDLSRLPAIITRYLPLWLLFFVPNAIMNCNLRFKDMPNWLSTLICAVINSLALILVIIIQYTTIATKGTEMPYAPMAGIMAFQLFPVLFYSAFSARYIYNKTGNVWLAGFINGTLCCLMTLYGASWTTDLILI